MRIKALLACLLSVLGLIFPSSLLAGGAKTVWVNSYTKKDGTYVSAHWRSPPDGTGAGISVGSAYYGGLYGTGTAVQPQKKNMYRYEVNVYEDGRHLCRDVHSYQRLKDSYIEAEESDVWAVQECLRAEFYKRGMDHAGVAGMLAAVFSREACKLESSAPMPYENIVIHESTMTCLIVSRKPETAGAYSASSPFPLTCQAMQDQSSRSTKCSGSSGITTLYHEGERVFGVAEANGLEITVSQLPDGSLVASTSNSGSAQVRLTPPARKK
jgi:hypothetical protein